MHVFCKIYELMNSPYVIGLQIDKYSRHLRRVFHTRRHGLYRQVVDAMHMTTITSCRLKRSLNRIKHTTHNLTDHWTLPSS